MTLDNHLGDALAGARTTARLMTAFSLLALMLAGLGIYTIGSFSVEQRAPELGIRAALGASRLQLVGMVMGETLVIVSLGTVSGISLTERQVAATHQFLA